MTKKERKAKRQRKYYEANKEKVAEYNRKYHEENPEYQRQWREENPEKSRQKTQRRRARKAELPATLTEAGWEEILAQHFGRCHYCGRDDMPLAQDHIIPVSKGGGYTKENIVPACQRCNSSKGTKDHEEFVNETKDRLQMKLF